MKKVNNLKVKQRIAAKREARKKARKKKFIRLKNLKMMGQYIRDKKGIQIRKVPIRDYERKVERPLTLKEKLFKIINHVKSILQSLFKRNKRNPTPGGNNEEERSLSFNPRPRRSTDGSQTNG